MNLRLSRMVSFSLSSTGCLFITHSLVFELDVNLLLNYVWSVDSMQKGEAWTPVCVPGCSEQYMLHVYTCFKQQNLGMVIVCCDHTPETLEACHDFCE